MSNIDAFVRLSPEWNEVGPSHFDLGIGTDQQFAFWTGGEKSHPESAVSIHTGVIDGPKKTPDDFVAMSDEEFVDASRTYQMNAKKGYAWNARGPCAIMSGAMRRAGYCRGEYTTPGKVYNGFIAHTVLTKRIVTVIYFTTRNDAAVWSEAEAITASVHD